MKVNGQLEKAQFEQIASAAPSPSPTGRVYANITNANKAIPTFYDGTNWRPMLMGQTSALISQNSGTACTVDWSTGLYQMVVLTNHAVISFSNPQSGQEHILVVQQQAQENAGALKTPFNYKFNMIDQAVRRGNYQPISCSQSSEDQLWRWFYSTTIKPGYATIPFVYPNPATLPASQSNGIDISPDGKFVCSGNTTSPFASVYPIFDGGGYLYYGNKNTVTPATAAAAIVAVSYSPDNNLIYTVGGTTPFLQGWFLDRGTGVTVLSNPVTIPTGAGQCVDVHPSGVFVAVGHTTTPFMSVYPVTPGAWGTKLTNPLTLPAAQVNSIAFSRTGDYLAAAGQTTPFLQVWPIDPVTGFGTISSNPSSLPTGGPAGATGRGVAWRPQGDYIAMANTTSPFLYIVNFNRASGAFGASISVGSSTLANATNCVAWTPDGQYLLVGSATTPFLFIYDFSAQTIGAPLAFDGANPGGTINDMVVHPNGEYVMLSLNATPFIKTYALPRKAKNYLRLNE